LSARARMRLGWTQLLGRARLALAAQKQAEAASPASRHRAGKLKRVEAQLRANMAAAEDKLSKLSQVGTCADVPATEEPAGTPPRTHALTRARRCRLPPPRRRRCTPGWWRRSAPSWRRRRRSWWRAAAALRRSGRRLCSRCELVCLPSSPTWNCGTSLARMDVDRALCTGVQFAALATRGIQWRSSDWDEDWMGDVARDSFSADMDSSSLEDPAPDGVVLPKATRPSATAGKSPALASPGSSGF
jgi:hypothetical protein